MKKIITILFILNISLTSCSKYLDIEPKGYTIPKTIDDYDKLLNNYALNSTTPFELEMLADDFYYINADTTSTPDETNTVLKAYSWLPYIYTTNYDLSNYEPWSLSYKNIFTYNLIINNIDNAAYGTNENKRKIKAQALFGRAYTFFRLVNLYAKQYTTNSAATDAGIPLVTSNDINVSLPGRGTVKQVYDLILKDLDEAIDGLPISDITKCRPNKTAAYALLARIYLHMRQYNKSIGAATAALDLQNNLINYNTLAMPEGDGKYSLDDFTYFEAPFDNNPENIYIDLYSADSDPAVNHISSEFEETFEESDLRRMFISPDPNVNPKKFVKNNYYYFNIGLTVPELYLIRAEANARIGKLPEALDNLNLLKTNRTLESDYMSFESSEKNEVIKWILEDKRKEFMFKGMRWFEMRRLSVDPEFSFIAYHELKNGDKLTLEPNSNRYQLAIPISALSNNIQQNPR